MSLSLLAVVCLGFFLSLSGLGALRESRDQVTLYDDFRFDLANGTAPVGQAGVDGQLLPSGTAVALLEIPSLKVRDVVVEGTTSGTLIAGPGHRRDTVLPGQGGVSVVMGRRAAFGGPFGDLGSLRVGDSILATTGQGGSTYKVVAIRRAGDPIPPAASKGRLILQTADGPAWMPNGLLQVDADLESDIQPSNGQIVTTAALSSSELPMQGDPTAWISLLLWGQLLLGVSIAVVYMWVRWGKWETWLIGIPVVFAVGLATASSAAQLLPNLL